ncbi:MAG: hypothetical protein KKA64_04895 [Nanoarchaeota archaeon]|nr:hypothetical protein [Nanoarchaeota archaeon]
MKKRGVIFKRATRALTSNLDTKNLTVAKSKRSQMELSFGMIFSIILIVVFIAFAFYAIKWFLNYQKTMQIGNFVGDFQADINRIYNSEHGSFERSIARDNPYYLPNNIKKVCIDKNSRLDFEPRGSGRELNNKKIEYLNIDKIITAENNFCIDVKKGKLEMIIEMNAGERLVTIGKVS